MSRSLFAVVAVALSLAVTATAVFAADNDPFAAGKNPAPPVAIAKKPAAINADYRTAEERIREALDQTTSIETQDSPTPLNDVVEALATRHKIPIVIDGEALKDAGVDPSATLIAKNLKDISLRSALNLLLRDLKLSFVIDDEVLLITSQDKASASLSTKVYDVRDLVDKDSVDDLLKLITNTVEPGTWKDEKGTGLGGLQAFTKNGVCVLVVYQTYDVHEKVAKLLE